MLSRQVSRENALRHRSVFRPIIKCPMISRICLILFILYIKQENPLKEYDNGRFDFINATKGWAFCFADMLKFQSTGTLS